jgi:hypothetical protein
LGAPADIFLAQETNLLSMMTLQTVDITDMKYFLGPVECRQSDLIKVLNLGVRVELLRIDIGPGVDQDIRTLSLERFFCSQVKSVCLRLGRLPVMQDFDLPETMRGVFRHIQQRDVILECQHAWIKQYGSLLLPGLTRMTESNPEFEIARCKFHTAENLVLRELDWDTWIKGSSIKILEFNYPYDFWLREGSILNDISTHCSNTEHVLLSSKTFQSDVLLTVEDIVCLSPKTPIWHTPR